MSGAPTALLALTLALLLPRILTPTLNLTLILTPTPTLTLTLAPSLTLTLPAYTPLGAPISTGRPHTPRAAAARRSSSPPSRARTASWACISRRASERRTLTLSLALTLNLTNPSLAPTLTQVHWP